MTVKGWLRALTGLTAAAVAFVGLLTWHVAAIVLGVGVLAVLALDDKPVEPVGEPGAEIPLMDLRDACSRGRA